MEVRPVRFDEQEEVAEILLAAYRAIPGDHLAGGYAGELADVASRSREAEVLEAGDSGIRMLAVRPDCTRRRG